MGEIEVLDLVLKQIGELRIPFREEELRQQVCVIAGNVQALRDAVSAAVEKAKRNCAGAESADDIPHAGCACTSAKEAAKDV